MFKVMTGVFGKKQFKPEEIEKIPSYLFCRYLGMSPLTVLAANQINYYYDIPIDNQFNMIRNAFGGKINYIQYLKNPEDNKSVHLELIANHYKISLDAAKEYIDLMSEEDLKNIVDLYIRG